MTLVCWPIPAAGRGLNNDSFTGMNHDLGAALQPLHAAIETAHPIFANLTWLAARQSKRSHASVTRQDSAVHGFKEANGAADTIAGAPSAAAAGMFADMKILQQHRKA